MRQLKILTAMLILSTLATGCKPPDPKKNRPDPVLSLIVASSDGDISSSNASMAAFRDTTIALRVLAMRSVPEGADADLYEEDELGPAKNETVKWEVVGNAKTFLKLSDEGGITTTDSDGFTMMEVNISPEARNSNYQVSASINEDIGVTFSLKVKDVEKNIVIEGSNSRRLGMARSDMIRVYVRNQVGGPIANEKVTLNVIDGQQKWDSAHMGLRPDPFTLDSKDENGTVENGRDVKLSAELITNAQGLATVYFFTGVATGIHEIKVSVDGVEELSTHTITYEIVDSTSGACEVNEDCSYSEICLANHKCGEPPIPCEEHEKPTAENPPCPAGLVCSAKGQDRVCEFVSCSGDDSCNAGNGGSTACEGDYQCAAGSYCSPEGVCKGQVCFASKQAGNYCIYHYACEKDEDCPSVHKCDTEQHYCIPWELPDSPLVVKGTWYTKYHMDLTEILGIFGPGGPIGEVITFLQLVTGQGLAAKMTEQLGNGIIAAIGAGILQSAIQSVVKEYVPPWITNLINVLGDFINLFNDMRANGAMVVSQPMQSLNLNGKIVQRPGTYLYAGERWENVILYLPSMPACKGMGRNSPNWPDCAAVNVGVDGRVSNEWSDSDIRIGVYNNSFEGEYIYGIDDGEPTNDGAKVLFKGRKTEMETQALIINMLDLIAQTVSASSTLSYKSFREMLCSSKADASGKVDVCTRESLGGLMCDGLGTGISKLSCKIAAAACPFEANIKSVTTTICEPAASAAATIFEQKMKTMALDLNITDMECEAPIEADPSADYRAGSMGVDGSRVNGTFKAKARIEESGGRPISGTWGGHRDANVMKNLED